MTLQGADGISNLDGYKGIAVLVCEGRPLPFIDDTSGVFVIIARVS